MKKLCASLEMRLLRSKLPPKQLLLGQLLGGVVLIKIVLKGGMFKPKNDFNSCRRLLLVGFPIMISILVGGICLLARTFLDTHGEIFFFLTNDERIDVKRP